MKIRAVIFDMDGVLIDSHPVHMKAWSRFLASVGKSVTPEELDFVMDGRKREDILKHFLGDLTSAELDEYGHRKEALFREEMLDISAVPGVEELLNDLQRHGIPMAIASCGSSSRVHYILQHLGIQHRFSAVVTGDDIRAGKPDPAIFKKAAEALAASSAESLVVEDAVSGVIGAKAAGMKCLAVASNGRASALREAGADFVVPDFRGVTVSGLLNDLS